MSNSGSRKDLSIMDAVDNLSSMAELEQESQKFRWISPEEQEKNQEAVKQTFRVVHNYLEHLYEKDQDRLKDKETQRGIQAIMVMAGEAAQKLGKYTNLFKGAAELKEYQDLQQFYLSKIMQRFQETLKLEEAWEEEWGGLKEEEIIDIHRRGLKDLETVRKDKSYELFYIRKEDGRPYFNRNLLRHIKLVGDFDETVLETQTDSPFARVKGIEDRDVHATAREVLNVSAGYVDEFYKEALRYKEISFVLSLNKALMALMLTANGRNLMQNTTGKNCRDYYKDFQLFLREALVSTEYLEFLESPPERSERFSFALINLCQALSTAFFMRVGTRQEAIDLIHRLIKKGEGGASAGVSFWNTVLEEDEQLRATLKGFPNGPLLKTLELFREEDEKLGFDPLSQHNFPSQLFNFSLGELHVSVLRVPAPIRQEVITKASVVNEFRGFLSHLRTKLEGKRYLLVNLQDRTSWEEHARCAALEELSVQEELFVLTLPRDTDFYTQSKEYEEQGDAEGFISVFKEQIASGESCGFYFPHRLDKKEIVRVSSQLIDLIWEQFFAQKNVLTRKQRLDFIEIFSAFFVLKVIETLKIELVSFTCKDAIDTGAAMSAGFFAFLRQLATGEAWFEPERDFFLWMLYAPALVTRERAIDISRLNRTISALAALDAELEIRRKPLLEAFSALYEGPLKPQLRIATQQ